MADLSRELLPCPFCGGEAKLHTYGHAPEVVECLDCGVCVEPDMWNRRTALSDDSVRVPRATLELIRIQARAGMRHAAHHYPNLEGDFSSIENAIGLLLAASEKGA